MTTSAPPADYYAGLNGKLLAALPPARRVLELGCAEGRLGRAYKREHAEAHWTGIDREPAALAAAATAIDRAVLADLERLDAAGIFGGPYDLVVFGDVVEHLRDPLRFLRTLRRLADEAGRLVCCIPNMNHLSVIERFLIGDLSYDGNGLLDATHVRLFSPASAIKTLLDAGWLPSLVDGYHVGGDPALLRSLGECARHLGASGVAFERNALTYQMIFDCSPMTPPPPRREAPRVSIVVPVTAPTQFSLNIARSPGAAEIGAEIVPVYGATSAADGFARGRAQAGGEWIVYCHQDVYLPTGSGHALVAALADTGRDQLLGAIGLAAAPDGRFGEEAGIRAAGTIVDRVALMRHPPAEDALSIDECFVALHRDAPFAIDPALGWHLWATDLALSARDAGGSCRIAEVPLFHNSLTEYALNAAFEASRLALFAKRGDLDALHTLCGSWRR